MSISARNQFKGTVKEIEKGAVNGIVKLAIGSESISATISMDAIKELGLAEGKEATAVVKATEVLVGTGTFTLSARNQFKGTVSAIEEGAVSGIVSIKISDDITVSATISMDAIKELGLAAGKEATAIVKATSVMIAC